MAGVAGRGVPQILPPRPGGVAAVRPGMPLYLAGAEMLAGPDVEAELRPTLPRRSSLATAFLHAGIDLRLYRDDARVSLLRPQRVLPSPQLNAQAIDLELNQFAEAAFFFRGLPQSGSLFFHPPQEIRIPSFDQKVAIKSSCTLLLTQAVPSGPRNRQRFAENLAAHDSQLFIDGGWMLPLGQEEATGRFAAAFRRLPAVHFHDAEESHAGQAVVFRWATAEGRTFAYAVNTTPFAVSAQVRVTATPNCTIEDLAGGAAGAGVSPAPQGRAGRLKNDADGLWWVVDLEPYDLAAVALSEPEVKLLQSQAALTGNVAEVIAQRIHELRADRRPPQSAALAGAGESGLPEEAQRGRPRAWLGRLPAARCFDHYRYRAGTRDRSSNDEGIPTGPVGAYLQRRADRLLGQSALRTTRLRPDYNAGLAPRSRFLAAAQFAPGRGRQAGRP